MYVRERVRELSGMIVAKGVRAAPDPKWRKVLCG